MEKKTVVGDWKQSDVKEVQWKDVQNKSKVSKEPDRVYKVTLQTNKDKLLGPIGIYIDPNTNQIVGHDGRN